jgi:hypothetical protein
MRHILTYLLEKDLKRGENRCHKNSFRKLSCFLLSPLLVFVFLLTSCDENREERETTPAGNNTTTETAEPGEEELSVIGRLVKTDTGVFRGVTFGMPVERVKSLEDTSQLEEENQEFVDYLVNFNFPETAEVIYFINSRNQVERIEAVVYPSDKDSQKKIFDELVSYYQSRYGNYSRAEGTVKWTSPLDSVTLELSKTDGQKVHDINLVFKPAEKPL